MRWRKYKQRGKQTVVVAVDTAMRHVAHMLHHSTTQPPSHRSHPNHPVTYLSPKSVLHLWRHSQTAWFHLSLSCRQLTRGIHGPGNVRIPFHKRKVVGIFDRARSNSGSCKQLHVNLFGEKLSENQQTFKNTFIKVSKSVLRNMNVVFRIVLHTLRRLSKGFQNLWFSRNFS